MKFEIDNQTLKDLEILTSSGKNPCVLDYLNFTKTIGGKNKLQKILHEPFSDYQKIQERIELINFFNSQVIPDIDIDKNDLDFIEHYLTHGDRPTTKPNKFTVLENTLLQKVKGQKNDQYIIERGVNYTILVFNNLFHFFSELENPNNSIPISILTTKVLTIKNKLAYKEILTKAPLEKLSGMETANFDYMIRHTNLLETRFLIDLTYELDVYFGMTEAIRVNRLTLPFVSNSNLNKIDIKNIFHIGIKNAVKNDVKFTSENNTMFISGPNMAGKSTLLKAISIAIYLAHCGLPIPAEEMHFSPLNGLYSTINLPDKLGEGQSHFLSEVRRLKEIATRLKERGNIFVVFDELFKGTNVKDAYEGSLAVIKAFSEISASFFIVSTHIVELTKKLEGVNSIQFKYLETISTNGDYKYSYKLKDGISEDRLGMYIINKEGLLELLGSCIEKENKS